MSKDTGITVSMKMSAKSTGALYMRNMANEKLITKQAEQIKMLRDDLARQDKEIKELKEWQRIAFVAHPNIDLDIESAKSSEEATKPVEE